MRTLTEQQYTNFDRDLAEAVSELREHASQHSYRADACRAIGEQVLAAYHRDHHQIILDLVQRLLAARATLAQRAAIPPIQRQARRTVMAQRTSPPGASGR